MALSLQTAAFIAIKPTSLIPIPEEIIDDVVLGNAIFSTVLSALVCLLVFNLLGDQLVNLASNTTSY